MIPPGGPILEETSTQAEALGTIVNDPGTGYNLKAELERAESDEYLYADLTSYPVVDFGRDDVAGNDSIAARTPQEHVITFDLQMIDSWGNTWEDSFEVTVQ